MKLLWQKATRAIARRLAEPVDRLAYAYFHDYPYGREPRAEVATYEKIWLEAKSKVYPVIDAYEREMGHAIDPDWFHQVALLTQTVIKSSGICYQHGRLLYALLASYASRHQGERLNILETGTARGFSALCLAKALEDSGTWGTIITFDVVPHEIPMFWNSIADAGGPRSRAELLTSYAPLVSKYIIFHQGDTGRELAKLALSRVHFAFLDGQHTYAHVMHEFNYIKNRQLAGDLIVFDDYSQADFSGVVAAVDEICDSHSYEKRILVASERRQYAVAIRR